MPCCPLATAKEAAYRPDTVMRRLADYGLSVVFGVYSG